MQDNHGGLIFDPDGFLLTYPIYVIFWGNEFDPASGRMVRRAIESSQMNEMLCIPLFTDEDLADRYRKSVPASGAFVDYAEIEDQGVLCNFLLGAKDGGFQGVVFDPRCDGSWSRGGPIDAIVKFLRSKGDG